MEAMRAKMQRQSSQSILAENDSYDDDNFKVDLILMDFEMPGIISNLLQ